MIIIVMFIIGFVIGLFINEFWREPSGFWKKRYYQMRDNYESLRAYHGEKNK